MSDPVYRSRASELPEYIEVGDIVEIMPGLFREVNEIQRLHHQDLEGNPINPPFGVRINPNFLGGVLLDNTKRVRFLVPDEAPS